MKHAQGWKSFWVITVCVCVKQHPSEDFWSWWIRFPFSEILSDNNNWQTWVEKLDIPEENPDENRHLDSWWKRLVDGAKLLDIRCRSFHSFWCHAFHTDLLQMFPVERVLWMIATLDRWWYDDHSESLCRFYWHMWVPSWTIGLPAPFNTSWATRINHSPIESFEWSYSVKCLYPHNEGICKLPPVSSQAQVVEIH